MKTAKALCLPLLAALPLAAGAMPASALDEQEVMPHGGNHAGWMPVSEDLYAPYEVDACGTTVTVAGGDVREIEFKEKVKKDGSALVRYRGDATVDITRGSPGDPDYAFIDELDVSGPNSQHTSADGRHAQFTFRGPGILSPTDPTSAAAFAEAGLPYFFYFEHGKVTARAELSEDPAVVEPLAVDVVHTPPQVVDVCGLLDQAAGM